MNKLDAYSHAGTGGQYSSSQFTSTIWHVWPLGQVTSSHGLRHSHKGQRVDGSSMNP